MHADYPLETKTLVLPCGHALTSRALAGPHAEEIHEYRLSRDAARHDCGLVSSDNPSGLRNKGAGE